ncbi:hypothetical protein HU200_065203 [Digitaria exilis]|uniref:Disease resistance protein winged helix domain-containing protein n=1 Tax=Digitaria exilis TaxID=1010633 RepID=A0A835DUU4_9POAL|nr:hypothetical protein HU200_065203 [Digitaria exilis]
MKIVNKCGGLPLAIKVMGGLLSTRSQIEREWEAVLNHRAWSISGLPDELDSRIYLSYEDLSPQLKQCFLYLSLFPKGTTIRQTDIVPMWIGEGFIQSCQGGSSTSTDDDRLEEVATEYYEELIMRNLIETTESTTKFEKSGHYKCTSHQVRGSEFQQAASSREVAFPNLASLYIEGLCEWEQWDWEDDVTAGAMAMPALEALTIKNCKLGRLPPGLATNNRHALRGLFLYGLTNLACVENFPSVLELDVFDCSELKRISGLPRLHKIGISRCPQRDGAGRCPIAR